MKFLSLDKVLEHARSSTGLADLLERSGQPRPTLYTIGMWKQRGLIPGWWAGCVIYALATDGVHPLHLLDETHPAVIRPEMAGTAEGDELLARAEAEIEQSLTDFSGDAT